MQLAGVRTKRIKLNPRLEHREGQAKGRKQPRNMTSYPTANRKASRPELNTYNKGTLL